MGATRDSKDSSSVTSETGIRTTDLGIVGLSGAVHLGAGGSANVFAARQLDTGEQVAVKLLRASADSDKERIRFEREQETLRALAAQDGIVPVLDAGLTDREEPYFLMPLMEGSLQDRIDNDGPLDWQTATQLMAEVSDTVEFAHSQKVLHRDLKPGNILLDQGGVPRVADFGIAKLVDSSVSKSSKALGTPSFMPPERFNGQEATAASDVYGLAATLSALITGSAPFLTGENDTDAAVMMRVISEEPPSLHSYGVPDEVAEAVQSAMAKDPSERPQSASDFAFALRHALDPHVDPALAGPVTVAIPRRNIIIPDGPVTSPKGTTIKLTTDEPKSEPNRKVLALLAAILFAVLVGGGAAFALTGDEPETDVAGAVETSDEEGAAEAGAESDTADAANVDGGLVDGDGGAGEDNSKDASDGEDEGLLGSENENGDDTSLTNENTADADGNGGTGGDGATPGGDGTPGDGGTPGDTGGDGGTPGDTGGDGGTPGDTGGDGGTPGDTGGDGGVVEETEPVACFTSNPTTVEIGQSVSFSNCSTDATSYSWSFGDNTTSAHMSPSKSWTTAGSKTVTLTATGPGGTDTETKWISVTHPPAAAPVACFTANHTTVDVGDSVWFSNCSTDATTYEWDFGDGGSSTHTSPSHTFTSHGSYTVRLTANGEGGSNSTTRTITVQAVHTPGPDAEDRWVTLAADETTTASDLTKGSAVTARVVGDSAGAYTYSLASNGAFSHSRQSDDAYAFWIDYQVADAAGNYGETGRIHLNVEAKADTGPEDRSRTITMSSTQDVIDVNLLGAGGNSARWLGGDDKHALYGTGQYLYAREDPGASTHTFQFYELLNQVIIVRWTVTVNVEAQA
ncbi:MAG: protein kinase [Acidimicrobiia bacterium]|nr:protein kinase [Acidimicrobiia bacterium]